MNDLRVDSRYAKEQKQRKVRKYAQTNLTDTQSSILLPLCAIFRSGSRQYPYGTIFALLGKYEGLNFTENRQK